jgi:hypothetical protein
MFLYFAVSAAFISKYQAKNTTVPINATGHSAAQQPLPARLQTKWQISVK